MNIPGTRNNNWRWRFTWDQIDELTKKKFAEMTIIYGRK
jgi:4-alpha-glucanotransferase